MPSTTIQQQPPRRPGADKLNRLTDQLLDDARAPNPGDWHPISGAVTVREKLWLPTRNELRRRSADGCAPLKDLASSLNAKLTGITSADGPDAAMLKGASVLGVRWTKNKLYDEVEVVLGKSQQPPSYNEPSKVGTSELLLAESVPESAT